MFNGVFQVPEPKNEPVLSYGPGTPQRAELKTEVKRMLAEEVDIPLIIGGKEVRTGVTKDIVCPHDRRHKLGVYHVAGEKEIAQAVAAANEAKREWGQMPWDARAIVQLKASELLAEKHRQTINASTMLCMSKTPHQAEIDAACELIDFLRFGPYFMEKVYVDQPLSTPGVMNYMDHRPLDGFVFAITPFNFTSIAGNLPTAPALMGNTVLWKPASSAVLPAYYFMKVLEEAGVPPGVINLIPGPGSVVGPPILDNLDLGGVHFTGSTYTFSTIWLAIGSDIRKYKAYPRIVGETGGKDFIFAHPSADIPALATALVRGAFEYQGQKCSAASRAYIPDSLWGAVKENMLAQVERIKMGDIADFSNFMGGVIDAAAYKTITEYIEIAKSDSNYEILCGGGYSDEVGWFIEPTVILTTDPKSKLMCEEIFGPVMTIYIYPEKKFEETLTLCDETSPYALTGAIFAQDRKAIVHAARRLRYAAGNFYVNDKPTGAVVGQQPFGGSRASGTNDKAGSALNLSRWVSPRCIKETFLPPTDFAYPYLDPDDGE